MAAGKTTVARALATRLGWQAEDVDELIEARDRRTVADIFARQGEPYFRALEREYPAAAPPAAPHRGGHRRRDVRGSGEPRGDHARRTVRLAGRAVPGSARPAACRRTAAAGGRQGADGAALRDAPARLRAGAPAGGRQRHACGSGCERIIDGITQMERLNEPTMPAYLVLSDIHSNIDALDAVLRIGARPVGSAAGARRSRRLRRRAQRGDRPRARAEPGSRDPRQSRQGRLRARRCGRLQPDCEWRRPGPGRCSPTTRAYLRALPAGPLIVDARIEICHGAPFDEDHYIFDAEDAQRAMATSEDASSACSATPTSRLARGWTSSGASTSTRRKDSRLSLSPSVLNRNI